MTKLPLLLLYICTLFTSATSSDDGTPSPSPINTFGSWFPSVSGGWTDEGGYDEVGGYVEFTQNPTINSNYITGRGVPTKTPTLKPTIPPTTEDFGKTIDEVVIPGICYDPPCDPPVPEEETEASEDGDEDEATEETEGSSDEDENGAAPAVSAAETFDDNAAMRIESTALLLLSVSIGGFVIMIGLP